MCENGKENRAHASIFHYIPSTVPETLFQEKIDHKLSGWKKNISTLFPVYGNKSKQVYANKCMQTWVDVFWSIYLWALQVDTDMVWQKYFES